MAHQSWYPVMREERPEAEIDACLSHYGRHWFLRTRLVLSGRGVEFLGEETAETLVPEAAHRIGERRYKVTERAFERICAAHSVRSEMLL